MKVELIAIGSELLLGQSTDTNSVWISQELAAAGIDCYHHSSVGDNLDRMVEVFSLAVQRSDAVICTGGLGPTQDDITRQAIAKVMGVELVTDDKIVQILKQRYAARNRKMADSNLGQALVPVGAGTLATQPGTAPGLRAPAGKSVVYAMPGVPYEMKEMFANDVLPDLLVQKGQTEVIASRLIRTWGTSEADLAEVLDDYIQSLDEPSRCETSTATAAFLASGVEGLKVRITAKAADTETVDKRLFAEEQRLREILGDIVFGLDSDTMESTIITMLGEANATLGVAESLTGGYIAGRICAVAGASKVFNGGVVAYSKSVKENVLGVTAAEQVSEQAALQMAAGVRKICGTTYGLATTGVAGPDELEGKAVGTVCIAIDSDAKSYAVTMLLPKNREQIRQLSTIGALNELRKFLGDFS